MARKSARASQNADSGTVGQEELERRGPDAGETDAHGEPMSKSEAIRRALAAGIESPSEGASYVRIRDRGDPSAFLSDQGPAEEAAGEGRRARHEARTEAQSGRRSGRRVEPGWPETQVTVEFRARGDGTDVALTHERFRDQADRVSHARGWWGCLNRLRHRFER